MALQEGESAVLTVHPSQRQAPATDVQCDWVSAGDGPGERDDPADGAPGPSGRRARR